ncbi:hypothetical protein [Escherichia coli]|nr:hypothetical protein [Escherichia coli]
MKPPLCCASPGSPLRSMAMVLADRSPIGKRRLSTVWQILKFLRE